MPDNATLAKYQNPPGTTQKPDSLSPIRPPPDKQISRIFSQKIKAILEWDHLSESTNQRINGAVYNWPSLRPVHQRTPPILPKSVYTAIRLFVYSSIRLFVYSSIRLFVYSSIRLFVYSSIRLFVYSSIRLFVYSSIRLFVYSSIRVLSPAQKSLASVPYRSSKHLQTPQPNQIPSPGPKLSTHGLRQASGCVPARPGA